MEWNVALLCFFLPTVPSWQVPVMSSHSGWYGPAGETSSRGEVQLRLLPLGEPAGI